MTETSATRRRDRETARPETGEHQRPDGETKTTGNRDVQSEHQSDQLARPDGETRRSNGVAVSSRHAVHRTDAADLFMAYWSSMLLPLVLPHRRRALRISLAIHAIHSSKLIVYESLHQAATFILDGRLLHVCASLLVHFGEVVPLRHCSC
ncbi:hypothetical protein Syun_012494 [Stephania yunnanensis]|uniref:Uncharacterized protein n=1 Tax=Stephania yunnanensis TaxID=152371 RepID=A0AAP0PHJ7_9MAGN